MTVSIKENIFDEIPYKEKESTKFDGAILFYDKDKLSHWINYVDNTVVILDFNYFDKLVFDSLRSGDIDEVIKSVKDVEINSLKYKVDNKQISSFLDNSNFCLQLMM